MALGYEQEMYTYFLGVNPGMSRRFPFKLVMEAYNVDQLRSILLSMIQQSGLEQISQLPASPLFDQMIQNGIFANQAGDMENLASIVVRRILASGGRPMTEALLLYCTYEYLADGRSEARLPKTLVESLKLAAERDIADHIAYRREFQLNAAECFANIDDRRQLRPKRPRT